MVDRRELVTMLPGVFRSAQWPCNREQKLAAACARNSAAAHCIHDGRTAVDVATDDRSGRFTCLSLMVHLRRCRVWWCIDVDESTR